MHFNSHTSRNMPSPSDVSTTFLSTYEIFLKATALKRTPASLKIFWLSALAEGNHKPVQTRQWLCFAMLEAASIISPLAGPYLGIVATLQAMEDYIAREDDLKESERVWKWLEAQIQLLEVE